MSVNDGIQVECFEKKKKTQKIGIIALYFRLVSLLTVCPRSATSLQLAHKENQCVPDLCLENDGSRDRCVCFFLRRVMQADPLWANHTG